jgi:hypothetical protein
MRYLIPLLLLVSCAQQPPQPPQTVYVTRTVPDCSWIPAGTYSVHDTQPTREWMIAYEKARQANCPVNPKAQ